MIARMNPEHKNKLRGFHIVNGEPIAMLDAVLNITNKSPVVARPDPVARPDAASVDAGHAAPPPKGSPQINIDPVVGVIIQFLNSSGRVETQSPSFAAEAYIRAGLTADGFSKSDAEVRTEVTV